MRELVGNVSVSRETMEQLKAFEALVLKWSPKINLISRDARLSIWERHILDSAQIFAIDLPKSGLWLDIGSGGGFPGVVAAVLLKEFAPDVTLTMIESDQRKATFLRTALRECGAKGIVISERIEDVTPQNAAILTARALSTVDDLLNHALRHMHPKGVALLHKGRNFMHELDVASKNWSFDVDAHQSLTAPDSRILEIRNIARATVPQP